MKQPFLIAFLAVGVLCACLEAPRPAESAPTLSVGPFGVTLNPGSAPAGAFGANLSPAQQSPGISASYNGSSGTPNGANGVTLSPAVRKRTAST